MVLSDLLLGLVSGGDASSDDVDVRSVRSHPYRRPSGHVTVVHECRHCGTTVSSETASCPVCDTGAIAEYTIE